jgi:uncharacterized repeat protein (TIGR01451 family)
MKDSRIPAGRTRASIGAVFLLVLTGIVALSGGATSGRAANAPGLTMGMHDPTALNVPTPGGNIGYSVTVTNNSTSTANHLSLSQSLSQSNGAVAAVVYADGSGISCPAVTTPPASSLSCQITKLDPNASFTVTVIFTTDEAATAVTDTAVLAFDSQTNGTANQKTVTQSTTTTLDDGLASSLSESLTLRGDHLTAHGGGGQTSDLTMPPGFLNNNGYVEASLKNSAGGDPACFACVQFQTVITIPFASSFSPTGSTTNPFWFGPTAAPAPFTWSLTLPGSLLPKNFKLHGVFHNGTLLPFCTLGIDGTPQPTTVAPGICVATLHQTPSTKTITATGLALTNGRYQFG